MWWLISLLGLSGTRLYRRLLAPLFGGPWLTLLVTLVRKLASAFSCGSWRLFLSLWIVVAAACSRPALPKAEPSLVRARSEVGPGRRLVAEALLLAVIPGLLGPMGCMGFWPYGYHGGGLNL